MCVFTDCTISGIIIIRLPIYKILSKEVESVDELCVEKSSYEDTAYESIKISKTVGSRQWKQRTAPFEDYEQSNLERHNSNIINRNYNLYLTF